MQGIGQSLHNNAMTLSPAYEAVNAAMGNGPAGSGFEGVVNWYLLTYTGFGVALGAADGYGEAASSGGTGGVVWHHFSHYSGISPNLQGGAGVVALWNGDYGTGAQHLTDASIQAGVIVGPGVLAHQLGGLAPRPRPTLANPLDDILGSNNPLVQAELNARPIQPGPTPIPFGTNIETLPTGVYVYPNGEVVNIAVLGVNLDLPITPSAPPVELPPSRPPLPPPRPQFPGTNPPLTPPDVDRPFPPNPSNN